MTFEPIVKWSGSKRSQAAEIISRMPREIDTYYEPFCGGCSVLYRLLQTPSVRVKRFVASDINADLIVLWKAIRDNPKDLYKAYWHYWHEFNDFCSSDFEGYERRKEIFYKIREEYNKWHQPFDLLFLMRTATNGMPRYNDKGEFNSSCHFSRPGMHPLRLREVLRDWHRFLKSKNVEFVHRSYSDVLPQQGDLVYLDPPYAGTKGMYFGIIDFGKYFEWLRRLKCKWIMSFDGKRGDTDNTYDLPRDLYASHEYLKSGNSSFVRYLGKGRTEEVQESLYMNFNPIVPHRPIQGELF